MNQPIKPLSAKTLYTSCTFADETFKTTADLPPIDRILGQDRAVQAVRFAIKMAHDGYNLFAFGPEGTGKYSLIRGFLEDHAKQRAVPSDWCYVHNFDAPNRPHALPLPAGRACALREDMRRLVEELTQAIPDAFEGDDYRAQRGAIDEDVKKRHEKAFSSLQKRAEKRGVAMIRTPTGLGLVPLKAGEVIAPDDFQKLPKAERERLQKALVELQEELEDIVAEIPKWEKEKRALLKKLSRTITQNAVGHLIDELEKQWSDLPDVRVYLEAVRRDVVEHAADFLGSEQPQQAPVLPTPAPAGAQMAFRRYRVNVMVDRSVGIEASTGGTPVVKLKVSETETCAKEGAPGAPVVDEENPSQPNLVGRIEHTSQFGALMTDFNLIKPGALHLANGGYLIIDAHKLLTQPNAWDALKSALRARRIRIETPAQSLGWIGAVSLDPEPIPLDVKVILIGEPKLYYLLNEHDPDFRELFKVAADFAGTMTRDRDSALLYARLIAAQVARDGLRHLDRKALARVVEFAAREAGDAQKLSTHMGTIVDLVREADFWAGERKSRLIKAVHVQQALDAQVYRADRLRELIWEEIANGALVIETEGAVIGQINGLSVIDLDGFAFGRPSRISCNVHLGKGEVVDIERHVELGGPLHSKGVMILEGFIMSRFGQKQPLALSATLTFEQSYGGVDGDSASGAELYALLSALSGYPISQSLAVTGSVDQRGRVQAIGGVNEKIEGFFDVCAARGLRGDEGVLIPSANVRDLMVRHDVQAAVRAGKFRVYAVDTVDQAIALLTGVPAGEIDETGDYPIGSVNRAVARTLDKMARQVKMFAAGPQQSMASGKGQPAQASECKKRPRP
ncbi:Lon protease family protein [Varunaivibrio sulfuroxidans]|uniref:endopeptidase La n=1 Tax=Varunaivibrio sulfuroxidans TaxID=1773489 RepID=A0A4R3JIX2_9PROT|nr:ATP-binding protein [Varunaivibrio sulfuroxidans]TCS64770.1 lon-related putative ATP-dependent protease [Varunaivibrio sulfuroxidans]WES29925.1 ATP-binding protein [Varunaivibrio sulfuroxidans]